MLRGILSEWIYQNLSILDGESFLCFSLLIEVYTLFLVIWFILWMYRAKTDLKLGEIFKCSISYLHSLHNMRIANILRFLGSVSRCFWWFMFSFARFALTAFIFSSMSCRRRPAWYSWVRRSARRIGVCLQLNLALILLSIWCHVSNKSMMIKYFSKDSAILIHKLCFSTTSTIQQHPTHLARSWFFTELVHIR